MKKKLLSILLIFALALSLAACGGEKSGPAAEEAPAEESSDSAASAEAEAPSEEAAEEPLPEEKLSEAEVPAEPAAEEAPEEELYGVKGYAVEYEPWLSELRASLPEPPDIDINSWEYTMANYYTSMAEYHPPVVKGFEGQGIDSRIEQIAREFMADCWNAGYPVYMSTAYRSYEFTFGHYQTQIKLQGSPEAAAKVFLPPGTNDHQTGLALDLTADPNLVNISGVFNNDAFLETDTYLWLKEHCAEYGFIERYPEGKEEFYGYPCHAAGHFRYVGKEAAQYITENNLCLEEFVVLYDPQLVYIPSKINAE